MRSIFCHILSIQFLNSYHVSCSFESIPLLKELLSYFEKPVSLFYSHFPTEFLVSGYQNSTQTKFKQTGFAQTASDGGYGPRP